MRTLDDYELFLDVAVAQGFSAASRLHNISQSTISKRMARLERSLGVERFQRRHPQPARLTEQGRRLQQLCREVMDIAGRIPSRLRDPGVHQPTARIGIDDLVPAEVSLEIARAVMQEFRRVEFLALRSQDGPLAGETLSKMDVAVQCGVQIVPIEERDSSALTATLRAVVRNGRDLKGAGSWRQLRRREIVCPSLPQQAQEALFEAEPCLSEKNVNLVQVGSCLSVYAYVLGSGCAGIVPTLGTKLPPPFRTEPLNLAVSWPLSVRFADRVSSESQARIHTALKAREAHE